jgi:hypothetical protein
LFGLPDDRLDFWALAEDDSGTLADTRANRDRFFSGLTALAPDVVLLPWRLDSNATHRLVYAWLAEWAATAPSPVVALGNEDPKTLEFQPRLRVVFDATAAAWKERLLECHQSQSARNLAQRGHTFAARILSRNRAIPGLPEGYYAERFQVECWGLG